MAMENGDSTVSIAIRSGNRIKEIKILSYLLIMIQIVLYIAPTSWPPVGDP